MADFNISALVPEIILLVMACAVLLVDAMLGDDQRDWVERLRLPGSLSAQLMSLRNKDSLAKGQVIALLIIALLDEDIEPKPNRQQMRALRYVLRELSDERIDTYKRLIWEASEMASA
ncbi:MAG: hypothetical protein EBW52_10130 [Betaproteobacteria bacterium]|nr:hypothetical protein [Betaproteobacteria bacterium]